MLLNGISSSDSCHSNDGGEEEGCAKGELVGLEGELFFEGREDGEVGFGVGDGGDDLGKRKEVSWEKKEEKEEGRRTRRTAGSSKRVRSSFPRMAC